MNEVFRRALVERERIRARDLAHEIFRIGTSHTRERRLPGEIGYEPAGIFTPDLREVDHYRYHDKLLPQVIGHTASKNGEIRYSPGSWLQRDYIAIDVGRQHGTGNGGLLLTDFGWVAVAPGRPARLVEVGPLFVRLAHEAAAAERPPEDQGKPDVRQMLTCVFQRGEVREEINRGDPASPLRGSVPGAGCRAGAVPRHDPAVRTVRCRRRPGRDAHDPLRNSCLRQISMFQTKLDLRLK